MYNLFFPEMLPGFRVQIHFTTNKRVKHIYEKNPTIHCWVKISIHFLDISDSHFLKADLDLARQTKMFKNVGKARSTLAYVMTRGNSQSNHHEYEGLCCF